MVAMVTDATRLKEVQGFQGITKLMSRDDVPVLISPGRDRITVHGTHDQHMIFNAFTTMLLRSDACRCSRLIGRISRLRKLASRIFKIGVVPSWLSQP